MDAKQFGSAMTTIAHGQAMMAAVRDYQREIAAGSNEGQEGAHSVLDVHEHLDDAELQSLHADRIAQMKADHEKRAQLATKGHGTYTEIEEGEFLEIVTKTPFTVVHFFHREFERCKILDKHLQLLATKYFKTRFAKLSAPDSPFFTLKLNIKTLPCLVAFKDGVSVGRVVGFDGLGGDSFPTSALEDVLDSWEVIDAVGPTDDEREQLLDAGKGSSIRKSMVVHKTESDEDSDFD